MAARTVHVGAAVVVVTLALGAFQGLATPLEVSTESAYLAGAVAVALGTTAVVFLYLTLLRQLESMTRFAELGDAPVPTATLRD